MLIPARRVRRGDIMIHTMYSLLQHVTPRGKARARSVESVREKACAQAVLRLQKGPRLKAGLSHASHKKELACL